MIVPPPYFEPIRERATRRWDQLEHDPELAGPWHQLFKQVQSPRHVLSELLQNADDANATEAAVRLEDRVFVFSHNGEDFTEEHFASLCRFGYSNKRALHTIGFRGIGFKSIFSLGGAVELYTPTLAVSFDRRRFTEPKWLAGARAASDRTEIRVVIGDELRRREVEKNLQDWLKSPVSLLFFRRIRRLRIGDQELGWETLGPGPVPGTEWVGLHADRNNALLVARSDPEPFPSDALAEIKSERVLGAEETTDFPPCTVEIVLGAWGQLYVVLPTGVVTGLPFAINAPFVQDPARLKIKDPETSPTNWWLLGRVGALAASAMLQWLRDGASSVPQRSRAYRLLPDVGREDSSLEGTTTALVAEAFGRRIANEPYLLTKDGALQPAGQSVVLPEELLDVWPGDQAATLLDAPNRPAFSRHVPSDDREKLVRWGVLEEVSKDEVLRILEDAHLPRPEGWPRLLKLWAYLAPEVTGYRYFAKKNHLRILPVQGKAVLYAADEVVRLGERRLLQSEADWDFLAAYLLVLNQNWLRFLAEQRRVAQEHAEPRAMEDVEAAYGILASIGMGDSSDASAVIEKVAEVFFARSSVTRADCVRLAQIAAKLGANAGEFFRFVTEDGQLRPAKHPVAFDKDGTLAAFFTDHWCASHLLHRDYSQSFTSCSSDDWHGWVSGERSGLHTFVPLVEKRVAISGRPQIEAELRRRGFSGQPSFPYKADDFRIEDWDFDESHWQHWGVLAAEDERVWGRLTERILARPEEYWSAGRTAKALQVAWTRTTRSIVSDPLLPAWILRLRDLPCLPDTRGFYRNPADLLRRTPETEYLMDLEPFVHGRLDTEGNRPLLELLGVRATPTGPDRVLDCLRALAKAEKPPVHEVEKWYRRLDQMIDTCSTDDLISIKRAFREENIILSDGHGWAAASSVFLSPDEEDVPGAAVVRTSVRDLALWRKVGVAERPTADLALEWLKSLSSGHALSQDDARRVRALLARYPTRIWNECEHWLNLAGEWAPVHTLDYSLTMQSLTPWSHLHEWVKQKTADLQRLPAEITEAPQFSRLAHLASRVQDRFAAPPLFAVPHERKAWLNQLGLELRRVKLDDEDETGRVRTLAADLAETVWQTTAELEIIPYLDGVPAGTPRPAEAMWLDKVLYVADRPIPKLARAVSQELGRAFRRQEIAEAIKFCLDRPLAFVTEYVEANFTLAPSTVALEVVKPNASADASQRPDGGPVSRNSSGQVTLHPEVREATDHDGTALRDNPADLADADQDDHDAENGPGSADVTRQKDRPQSRPTGPSMIERFARANGFQKDGEARFFHSDGSWIARTRGSTFPWERRKATGEIVRCYWVKDHCLEREPLEIEADIWALIDRSSELHALILCDLQGDPIEVPAARLRTMVLRDELTLYPASYRLVAKR